MIDILGIKFHEKLMTKDDSVGYVEITSLRFFTDCVVSAFLTDDILHLLTFPQIFPGLEKKISCCINRVAH